VGRDILDRLQEIEDDPAATPGLADIASDAMAEIRALRGMCGMTTDPEEGQRQAEAMQPPKLKVGDKVRLKAGSLLMRVVSLEDYGNQVVCEGEPDQCETYSARSLVLVASEVEAR
jgi:hypothetical protein